MKTTSKRVQQWCLMAASESPYSALTHEMIAVRRHLPRGRRGK